MPKIRVLIADDHALVRSGLRALLAVERDIDVVGEAADGAAVIEPCLRLAPDVVLMDLTMPGRGGVAATAEIRQTCSKTKVLVLTMHEDECYARQALLAGASGYLLKKAVATELLVAIRAVHRGERHVSASLGSALTDTPPARPNAPAAAPGTISPREREVIGLLALGHTNAEVAARLHIGVKTVETHRMHILEKLNLHTRADLVRFAMEYGLLAAS